MDIYHYNPQSGELMGSGLADPDPLAAGNWLIPANATTITPPAAEEGKARVFSEGAWTQVDIELEAETAPLSVQVNIERDRRIAEGSIFTVTGYGDIPLTGTTKDMTILTALLIKAQGLKAAAVTDPVLVIRDKNNVTHNLTPDQMIELVSIGMGWIEATMQVSWDMKDGIAPFEAGIPADFATNESYWP